MCCSARLCVLVSPAVAAHAVTATTQKTTAVQPLMLPQPENDTDEDISRKTIHFSYLSNSIKFT